MRLLPRLLFLVGAMAACVCSTKVPEPFDGMNPVHVASVTTLVVFALQRFPLQCAEQYELALSYVNAQLRTSGSLLLLTQNDVRLVHALLSPDMTHPSTSRTLGCHSVLPAQPFGSVVGMVDA